MSKAERTFTQGLRWWWNTRVRALWTVLIPSLRDRAESSQRERFAFAKCATPLLESEAGKVTVILTVYKRSQYLPMQIRALKEQTCPPDEIWVWCNENDEAAEDYSSLVDRVIVTNTNWKFWGRFAIANLARTPYIALFDDDILPQARWIENCLNTVEAGCDGILGGSGVVLPVEGGYSSKHKVGWNGHHYDSLTEVDLVGHAWFLQKSHLQYMWMEQPDSWENGEDIHLSYSALKYGGIKTYVPPHPESQPELWSCLPDFGKVAAKNKEATRKTVDHKSIRSEMVDSYRDNGWRITAERTEVSSSDL